MSLLDSALKGKREVEEQIKRRVKGDDKRVTKIIDSAKFVAIIDEVCDRNTLRPNEVEACVGYRTRVRVQAWPLRSLMTAGESEHTGVTAKTWASIVKAAIEGMIAQIKLAAPNGSWAIVDHEARMANDPRILGGDSAIVVAIKFVDTLNGDEWTYTRGRPDVRQVQSSGFSADDLVNILAAFTEAGDTRMESLISEIRELASNRSDGLPEIKEAAPAVDEKPALAEKPTRKKRVPRKPRGA